MLPPHNIPKVGATVWPWCWCNVFTMFSHHHDAEGRCAGPRVDHYHEDAVWLYHAFGDDEGRPPV